MAEPKTFNPPTDEQLIAIRDKAAKDTGLSKTSNGVCLLATMRILHEFYHVDKATTQAFIDFAKARGHGLGCNASQFGAWGKKAEGTIGASGLLV